MTSGGFDDQSGQPGPGQPQPSQPQFGSPRRIPVSHSTQGRRPSTGRLGIAGLILDVIFVIFFIAFWHHVTTQFPSPPSSPGFP